MAASGRNWNSTTIGGCRGSARPLERPGASVRSLQGRTLGGVDAVAGLDRDRGDASAGRVGEADRRPFGLSSVRSDAPRGDGLPGGGGRHGGVPGGPLAGGFPVRTRRGGAPDLAIGGPAGRSRGLPVPGWAPLLGPGNRGCLRPVAKGPGGRRLGDPPGEPDRLDPGLSSRRGRGWPDDAFGGPAGPRRCPAAPAGPASGTGSSGPASLRHDPDAPCDRLSPWNIRHSSRHS